MPLQTTLRDVAAAAGVSVSAASLALAGSVRISAATALRVRTAAATLGYVRNHAQAASAASRFRHGGRPSLIAVWMEHARGREQLREAAADMGMSVVSIETGRETLAATLLRIAPAALVVQRRTVTSIDVAELGLPVVLWGDEGEGEPAVDCIETCEWWTASVQAVDRVHAAGYRRLAAVLIPARLAHWHDDVRLAAMRSQKVPVLVWDGVPETLEVFIRRHQPDAVVGGGIRVWHTLQRLGLDRPFAALMTFDTPWHRTCAGWREQARKRPRMTLELIEQRLRYGERPPCRIVIAPHWHAGSSLPPVTG